MVSLCYTLNTNFKQNRYKLYKNYMNLYIRVNKERVNGLLYLLSDLTHLNAALTPSHPQQHCGCKIPTHPLLFTSLV